MHPDLAKAVKTAQLGKTLNGGRGLDPAKEISYRTEIARLRIKLDESDKIIKTLKTQLIEALAKWPREHPPTLMRIMEATAREFGMVPRDVMTTRRHADQAMVRQVMCYMAFTMTAHTDNEIAQFVKRDRTSVIHGRKKIAKLLPIHEELRSRVEAISVALLDLG